MVAELCDITYDAVYSSMAVQKEKQELERSSIDEGSVDGPRHCAAPMDGMECILDYAYSHIFYSASISIRHRFHLYVFCGTLPSLFSSSPLSDARRISSRGGNPGGRCLFVATKPGGVGSFNEVVRDDHRACASWSRHCELFDAWTWFRWYIFICVNGLGTRALFNRDSYCVTVVALEVFRIG